MKKNASIKMCFLLFLFLIHATKQKFLQFDTKTICPNPPLTSLGILISLAESDESGYTSTLSPKERKSYEDIVDLKRSFSSTMSYIPHSFSPENDDYWAGIDTLLFVFIIISIFPTIFIIFYIFMRFVLKKCTGPKKTSQVNKMYRNLTWFIMLVSSIVTAILFAVVLGKSVAVGNNIEQTFNYADRRISESNKDISEINKKVILFRENNLDVPNENYMKEFQEKIGVYISNTKSRTQQILDDDGKRTKITGFVFAGYYVLVILAYLFFFLKSEKLECIISIILFFAIPSLIILEGYNAKFFFYYGDLCDSVNKALYGNEFPVADQSLGYYYNCFPTDIKANLYNIRYKLYEQQLKSDNKFISGNYSELNENTFTKLFNCEIVHKVIPKIESDFCKDSLNHMYSLIEIMTWLILTSFGVALGARRLQVLIWKKRQEIESMMQNQEILY